MLHWLNVCDGCIGARIGDKRTLETRLAGERIAGNAIYLVGWEKWDWKEKKGVRPCCKRDRE